jgi:WD40 repeat protein
VSRELTARVASSYPLPIADAASVLAAADGLHERRDRVVECFRATLRLLASIALSVRVQFGAGPGGESAEVADLVRGLRGRGLTDGQWLGLLREILRAWADAPGKHPLPALVELFHGKAAKPVRTAIDGLLEMRKAETVAHGASGDAEDIAEILARREPQLYALLEAIAPLWAACELVVPQAMEGERQACWSLMRDTPPRRKWSRTHLEAGRKLPPNQAALIDGAGRPLVALHPVALFLRPSADAPEELFVLDGAKKGTALYVAFPSMAEHRATDVWTALGALLGSDDADADAATGATRPFRGLGSFGREHAALFFGRDRQADALANRVRSQPMVTVTGPSGAGKSSLIAAGVLPRLGELAVAHVRPGPKPIAALARRLVEATGEPRLAEVLAERPETLGVVLEDLKPTVIVIDQAEELFTVCTDAAERLAFATAIASAGLDPDGTTRVIISLREDFFARLATLEPLRDRYHLAVEVVTAPGPDDLFATLVEPLRAFDFQFEDAALPKAMIDAVAGEPAALALLQFCADLLWDQRDRTWKRLTWDAYKSLGGVVGAIAGHADAVIDAMTPAQQATARHLLVRLVTAERTRAVVGRRELLAKDEGASAVLTKLVDARLVTAREAESGDDGTIELAHEALLVHWKRLAGWLEEDGELVRARGRVEAAAKRWAAENRSPDLLLGEGKPLAEGEQVVAALRDRLDAPVVELVAASVARRATRRRLRRGAIAALGALAAAAAIAAVIALAAGARARDASKVAETQREAADKARKEEKSQRLDLQLELARNEVIAGRPLGALPRLVELRAARRDTPEVQLLVADATRSLDSRIAILPHHAPVTSVAFEPAGHWLVTGDTDGAVSWWDAADGHAIATQSAGSGIDSLAVAPDGHTVATGHNDGTLRLWTSDGKPLATIAGGKLINTVAFSPDGAHVISAAVDGELRLYDVASRSLARTVDAHNRGVSDCAWSPDGKLVATAGGDGKLRLWTPSGEPLVTFDHPKTQTLQSVRFDPTSRRLVTTADEGEVYMWSIKGGAPIAHLEGHADRVWMSAFDPSGRWLATASYDATARIWDAHSGTLRATLTGHTGVVGGVAFLSDGHVVTTSQDGTARVWDPATGVEVATLFGHTGSIESVAVAGDRIVTASTDGTARLWKVARPEVTASVRPRGALYAAAFTDNGKLVVGGQLGAWLWKPGDTAIELAGTSTGVVGVSAASGSVLVAGADGVAHIYDANDGHVVAQIGDEGLSLMSAVRAAGMIATGSYNGVLRVFKVDGTKVGEVHFDGTSPVAVRADPAGTRLLAFSQAGAARLVDPATTATIAELAHGEHKLQVGAFSPDGKWVALGGEDRVVRVFTAGDGKLVASCTGHRGSILALDFTSDSASIVSASNDGLAIVWSLPSCEGRELRGHRGPVRMAVASPDGTLIATAGADGAIRLWAAANGDLVRELTNTGHPRGLTFSPDGTILATSGSDGVARLWPIERDHRSAAELARLLGAGQGPSK